MRHTTPASAYACPVLISEIGGPAVACGLPTRVYNSRQGRAGRFRRRVCDEGHRCTTVERPILGGVGDAGAVVERAAWHADTLRDLLDEAARLLGGPLPRLWDRRRPAQPNAPQAPVQEDTAP